MLMKKYKVIIILLILVIIIEACWIFYLNISHPSWDNVSITIKEGSLSPTGLTLIVNDKNFIKTNYEFCSKYYFIDRKIAVLWTQVYPDPDDYPIRAEELETFVASLSYPYECVLNWGEKIGSLEPGNYRIRFAPTNTEDYYIFEDLFVEFTI